MTDSYYSSRQARVNGRRVFRLTYELNELRALLAESATALAELGEKALEVKPTLDRPTRPNDPDPSWTPWNRYLEVPVSNAQRLAAEIRTRLNADPALGVCEDSED